MSKQYKNKTCIYCTEPNSSSEGDHVIAREFFLVNYRANLPKVPACKKCNNDKSKLEHYLTAILPIGARHIEANTTREALVPPRLEKNLKLKSRLLEKRRFSISPITGEPLNVLFPLEGEKIADLFKYIVKGLVYHHWQKHLPEDKYFVRAGFLNQQGVIDFEEQMKSLKQEGVSGNLGNDTFVYEGAKLKDDILIWRMSLYGGLTIGTRGLSHISTNIYGAACLHGLQEHK